MSGQALPLPVVRSLGRAIGFLAWLGLRDQRRLAMRHLEQALGSSLRASQRRAITRRLFMNLGQTAMEWMVLPRLSLQTINSLIRAEGLEHLRAALAQGNGAIVITPHLSNWELIPLYLRSLGFEGGVLARRLRYPEYESFLIQLRGAHGIPTMARGSLKDVATLLRKNQIVGLLPDHDIDSLEGIFVPFFGRPAYTVIGPAALSVMTGAPLVPCFLIRDGGRFRLLIEQPLRAQAATNRAEAMAGLTRTWSAIFETYIRRHPDQWVWMHRRWKTQPSFAASPARSVAPAASQPGFALGLTACCLWFSALLGGCSGDAHPTTIGAKSLPVAETPVDPSTTQQMSTFMLTGYRQNGSKEWELQGQGASANGQIVTIHRPSGVGYDPQRTAYLSASLAQVNQTTRHIRLEHDVAIHTSDGLWFFAPLLHWAPDRNEASTDTPVKLETDHMLLWGRGMTGLTQLKRATLLTDIELILNPSDRELGAPAQHVRITCDGPLTFDYERNVATFEQNVHVEDPTGDLYSDTLVAYIDQATHTIRYAEATGRVRIVQSQNTAYSDRAMYEPRIGKITLAGKPSLLVYPSGQTAGPAVSFGGLTGAARPVTEPARPAPLGGPGDPVAAGRGTTDHYGTTPN